MSNLDSILQSRDITMPTKVRLVKAMVFPVDKTLVTEQLAVQEAWNSIPGWRTKIYYMLGSGDVLKRVGGAFKTVFL